MSKTVLIIASAVILFLVGSFGYQIYQDHLKNDLNVAVPSIGPERMGMFKMTAYQLTPEEVEKASGYGFFTYVEKFIKIKKRNNPITLSGEEIEKVPPTNPNIQNFKDAILFRSCFYNSQEYTLESKKGLFVSQGLLFKNRIAADRLEKSSLNGFRNHYFVVLRKGNTIVVVNMWLDNTEPTKELLALVEFSKAHGFKAVVKDNRQTQ